MVKKMISEKFNIISINNIVLKQFEKEKKQKDEARKNIHEINSFLLEYNDTGQDLLNNLNKYRDSLFNFLNDKNDKYLYIAKTKLLINEYENILKIPILSQNINEYQKKKNKILYDYINIIKNLIKEKNWTEIPLLLNSKETFSCQSCDNKDVNKFEIDEYNRKICLECATQQDTLNIGFTHKDYNRINMIGKFVYNRIIHFQDCIKQYQGKQNCKIPQKVYDDLDKKFKAYRLLIESENESIKYSKITRDHINMFLKELKYTKHYENVNLIYFNITGKRFDDISYLEHLLIEDFKELVNLYDELHGKDKPEELDRKNFMNVQYILFQLLKKYEHPCKIEDFSILKTIDRKIFHDKICSKLFKKLNWNFTPTF